MYCEEPSVILYAGKIGAGKGYMVSKHLEGLKSAGNRIFLTSFADPFKQFLYSIFGLSRLGYDSCDHPNIFRLDQVDYMELLESEFTDIIFANINGYSSNKKDAILGLGEVRKKIDEYGDFLYTLYTNLNEENYDQTYRKIMQCIGTEIGRGIYDNIWIDNTLTVIMNAIERGKANCVVVDDLRFLNEYENSEIFCEILQYEFQVWGVTASEEVRAKRRNITVEELQNQSLHGSELEVNKILDILDEGDIIINE